jgi:hypothetical protein
MFFLLSFSLHLGIALSIFGPDGHHIAMDCAYIRHRLPMVKKHAETMQNTRRLCRSIPTLTWMLPFQKCQVPSKISN